MTTVPRRPPPATGLTGLRRLGVLLVLAGVLAMHAVGGGNHMAMAGAAEAGGQPAVSATAGEPAAAGVNLMPDVNLMAGRAPAHGGAVPHTGTVPAPLDAATAAASPAVAPGSGVQTACLAVLLGLVLLAAPAALGGVPRLLHAPAANSAGHTSVPLGRGPPRQLLAQLCVLRT